MFSKIVKELAYYSSAVLTGLDTDGYPFSVRCKVEPDATSQVLRVRIPEDVSIQPGLVGLLCHKHDDLLRNQRSFLVRGTLERRSEEWTVHPVKFIPGIGVEGLAGFVKFVFTSRRDTKHYLAKRGLARPAIPWDDMNRIKERAKRGE